MYVYIYIYVCIHKYVYKAHSLIESNYGSIKMTRFYKKINY